MKLNISSENSQGLQLTKTFNQTLRDVVAKIEESGYINVSAPNAPFYDPAKQKITRRGTFYQQSWTRDVGRAIHELICLEEEKSLDIGLFFAQNMTASPKRWARITFPDGSGSGEDWVRCSNGLYETDGHGLILIALCELYERYQDSRLLSGIEAGAKWLQFLSKSSKFHHLLYSISECSDHIFGGYDIYSNSICVVALRKAGSILNDKSANLADLIWKNIKKYLTNKDKWVMASKANGEIIQHQRYSWIAEDYCVPAEMTGFQLMPMLLNYDFQLGKAKEFNGTFEDYVQRNNAFMEHHKQLPFAFYGPFPMAEDFHHICSAYHHLPMLACCIIKKDFDGFVSGLKTTLSAQGLKTLPAAWRWIVPEYYCVVNGKIQPAGDIGNLINEAEFLRVVRFMCGIFADTPALIRVAPFFPEKFSAEISTNQISYIYKNHSNSIEFEYYAPKTTHIDIELGPIPPKAKKIKIVPKIEFKIKTIGNYRWIFVQTEMNKNKFTVTWEM